jgi:GxxExxY protein
MTENEIATKVLDAAFRVHTELGPGLLEVVYRTAMVWELMSMGLHVQIEHPIPLIYRGDKLRAGFRADLLVEGKVIVELKSMEVVPKVARKILLAYIRVANMKLGLLINFGEEHLKDGIERVVNNL